MKALFLTTPSIDRDEIIDNKGDIALGTCGWIKDVDEFKSWFEGPTHLLWISGGPGKGKTFLSIYLTRYFSEIAKKMASEASSTMLVLEFFCNNTDDKRNTALALLRGLLYQLLDTHEALFDYILPKFELLQDQNRNLFSDTSLQELWGIFKKMIGNVPGEIYFVLDGLDECDSASIRFLKLNLENTYSGSDSVVRPNIKTIIVSRRLATEVRNALWIDLDEKHSQETEDDLKAFISSRISRLFPKSPGNDKWLIPLASRLLERANGTFLWVGLAIQVLEKHRTEIRKVLGSEDFVDTWLPVGLDAMYDRMLLEIPESEREVAAKIVCWVSMARRQLTLAEICVATRDEPPPGMTEEDWMRIQIDSCGHLLSTTKDGKLQLVHLSLKEYLLRIPSLAFGIQEETAHKDLWLRCLELLQTLEKDICKLRLPGALATEAKSKVETHLPLFVQYACRYWVDHLKRSGIELCDNGGVHLFLKEHFLHWLEALSLMGQVTEGVLMITALQSMITVSDLGSPARIPNADMAAF
jgi:hypothetical protein